MDAPTEDTVQALMDYLVDPVLPLNSKSLPVAAQDLSLDLHHSIARQMHAVVLLYNYYHRKQFPKLEFLDFSSFCKVAVNARPNLISFLSCMQQPNQQLNHNSLSLTEKQIMNACNISLALHSLKEASSTGEWPVSEIAVFLTDGRRENCALHFSAITQGVWSLMEKDDDNSLTFPRESSNWPVKATDAEETRLQKLAMSVVQGETGIDPREISILESHVAYSLREEKTATRLFIMKCNTIDEEVFQVPIKDAIDSLQGPLVKKSCNSYVATDVVEYFHLLPYAGMITDWFSREVLAKEENTKKILSSKSDVLKKVVTFETSSGSPVTCQDTEFAVLKTNKAKKSDQKENGDYHVRNCTSIAETESPKLCPIKEERETTSKTLDDNVVTQLSGKGDLRSTRNGSTAKEDMLTTVTEASTTDGDIDDAKASKHAHASTDCLSVASEQVLVMSGIGISDFSDPLTRSGPQKSAGSAVGAKRALDFEHGEGDKVEKHISKELVMPYLPTDDDPDRLLLSCDDKVLLTGDILKVFDTEQTPSMIRKIQACKNWKEAEEIKVEILNRRNDLLGRTRKRQHLDISSDVMSMCTGNNAHEGHCLDPPIDSSQDVTRGSNLQPDSLVSKGSGMQNGVHGHCLDICKDGNAKNAYGGGEGTSLVNDAKGVSDMLVEKVETQGLMIPQSTPEDIVRLGAICFPKKYLKLYEGIVARFGDIIMPESKEARLCSDMVSATVIGLLEVVNSMLHVSPRTVDAVMLETWELKLRFFEVAGLKVGWLRDHFVQLQQAFNPLMQELEDRKNVLSKLLEAKRKQADDLCNELELVRAEEKALLEQKLAVAADLEDVELRQERFKCLSSRLNI